MPSQKELRWSQLKVGILALVAFTALTVLIFLMSGSTGGLFTRKLNLKAYFPNANGLKIGAPVTLDGVTIGNVTVVQIIPSKEPNAVEVVARVGAKFISAIHTDSMASIDQAQILTTGLSSGKGTLGKLLTDDQLYTKANTTIDKLSNIVAGLDSGKGTAGKLLKDDALYKNLNNAIENTNTLLAGINSGKGSLGRLAKDPAFALKVEDTLTHLNTLLQGMNEGKGTLGQLTVNRSMYDSLDHTIHETGDLITAIRKDPKTYLNIRVRIF